MLEYLPKVLCKLICLAVVNALWILWHGCFALRVCRWISVYCSFSKSRCFYCRL